MLLISRTLPHVPNTWGCTQTSLSHYSASASVRGHFPHNSWSFVLRHPLPARWTDRDAEASQTHHIRSPSNQKAPVVPRPQMREQVLRASDLPKTTPQEGTPQSPQSAPDSSICLGTSHPHQSRDQAPHYRRCPPPRGLGTHPLAASQATRPAKGEKQSPGVCVAGATTLCSGFHRHSVPGPAPLRSSQPPSPCLAGRGPAHLATGYALKLVPTDLAWQWRPWGRTMSGALGEVEVGRAGAG